VTEGSNTFARYTWAAGFGDGESIGYFNTGFGSGQCASQFYLRYDFRYSSNFTVHSAANKQVYLVDTSIDGNAPLYLSWRGGIFEIDQQGAGPSANYGPNSGNANAGRGSWHRVEMVVRGDGSAQLWVDGTQTHNYGAGTFWSSGRGVCFDRINFDSVWGGDDGSIVPQVQTLDFDNIYISKP
jgi:hypothetical protein